MPISDETAKILEGEVWASAAGALKQDPGDATPAVTRANGWTAPYSSTIVPEQETFQGRFNELDSAVVDIFTAGVPFYDARIDYPAGAVTNEAGTLSRALRENGPNQANAAIAPSADSAGTTWATISGVQTTPGAPGQPTATSPAFGTLDWAWNCPLDGGSIITAFRAQWRRAGQSWPGTEVTINMPVHPFLTLTGLSVGTYELRVKAVTAIGESANWSPTGSAVVAASLPGGGNTLALRAEPGDGGGEADLAWIEPDLNGGTLLRYEVQWRTGGQSFSSVRQNTFAGTTGTITGLTNGTEHFFQVRAVTNAGNGAWSNVASATPEAVTVSLALPSTGDRRLRGQSVIPVSVLWEWGQPDDGGRDITSYHLQWREQGDAWVNANIITGIIPSCYLQDELDAGTTYEARVRGVNSVGNGAWSPTASAEAGATGGGDVGKLIYTAPHDGLEVVQSVLQDIQMTESINNFNALEFSHSAGASSSSRIYIPTATLTTSQTTMTRLGVARVPGDDTMLRVSGVGANVRLLAVVGLNFDT